MRADYRVGAQEWSWRLRCFIKRCNSPSSPATRAATPSSASTAAVPAPAAAPGGGSTSFSRMLNPVSGSLPGLHRCSGLSALSLLPGLHRSSVARRLTVQSVLLHIVCRCRDSQAPAAAGSARLRSSHASRHPPHAPFWSTGSQVPVGRHYFCNGGLGLQAPRVCGGVHAGTRRFEMAYRWVLCCCVC